MYKYYVVVLLYFLICYHKYIYINLFLSYISLKVSLSYALFRTTSSFSLYNPDNHVIFSNNDFWILQLAEGNLRSSCCSYKVYKILLSLSHVEIATF